MGEAVGPESVLRQRAPGRTHGDDGAAGAPSKSSSPAGDRIPPAEWTFSRGGLPQAVAHRGYKAHFPENTMEAFRGAVEVGAHAIETDVHLSKDDVVVISHDKDLKRCYGVEGLVRDHDWSYLQTLRTVREPRQPMPRLSELLAYLAEPGREAVWLLLDIKVDDAPEVLIPRIAETLAAAAAAAAAPSGGPAETDCWARRVVLGCWTARQLRACREALPGLAVAWIGITPALAREYLRVPGVALNARHELLYCRGVGGGAAGGGRDVVRACRDGARRRPLYGWTVNKVPWMRWAIRDGLDCVITDDPKLFLEVCEQYRREEEAAAAAGGPVRREGLVASVRATLYSLFFPLLVTVLIRAFGYYKRVGTPAQTREGLRHLVEAKE